MDKAQVVKWGAWWLAKGLVWMLTTKFLVDAANAETFASQIANAIGVIVLAGWSAWENISTKKKLLNATPTAKE